MNTPLAAAIALALGGLAAAPAMATNCEELWMTRNLIFDRAGHCFESNLGRAIFNNADCTTSNPQLSRSDAADVAMIQGYERELGCNVNTSRTSLNIPHLAQRLSMADVPVPSIYASACYGYQGPSITLYGARSEDSWITGEIPSGGDLVWTFEGKDGWSFVTAQDGSANMGWYRESRLGQVACTASAG